MNAPASLASLRLSPRLRSDVAARFWSKVDRAGECWLWTACLFKHGYGKIGRNGRVHYAHRVSWEMAHGPIPDGLHVLHRCDVKKCVRPSHLFLGTNKDNMLDKQQKGRCSRTALPGAKNGRAKLTLAGVLWIQVRRREGASQPTISREVGVHNTIVSKVLRGDHWIVRAMEKGAP